MDASTRGKRGNRGIRTRAECPFPFVISDRPSFSDVALATSIAEEEEEDSNGNNVSGKMPAIF